jgi:hypothetical protein
MNEPAQLLIHYLRTVWVKAGLTWDADNDAEIRGLVEDLDGPKVRAELRELLVEARELRRGLRLLLDREDDGV